MQEIRTASENIAAADAANQKQIAALEQSVNEPWKRAGRPGAELDHGATFKRKDAIGLCHNRRALTVPKINGGVSDSYTPTPGDIDEALLCRKAMRSLLRHGDVGRLEPAEKKSLSAFAFGNNGFLLAPEMSNQVLRCIVDPTDVSGMVNKVAISSGSIRFLIDNSRTQIASWACDASCFANNPQPGLAEGLGMLEIKAEPLRFVACASTAQSGASQPA